MVGLSFFDKVLLPKTWFVFIMSRSGSVNGSHPLLLSPHICPPLSLSVSVSVSLPFSSQFSVYVTAVAEEDGGEKIMLSGTLGGNSLKLK